MTQNTQSNQQSQSQQSQQRNLWDEVLKAGEEFSPSSCQGRRVQAIRRDMLKDVARGALLLTVAITMFAPGAIASPSVATDTEAKKETRQGLPSCLVRRGSNGAARPSCSS